MRLIYHDYLALSLDVTLKVKFHTFSLVFFFSFPPFFSPVLRDRQDNPVKILLEVGAPLAIFLLLLIDIKETH